MGHCIPWLLYWRAWQPCHQRMIRGWAIVFLGYFTGGPGNHAINGRSMDGPLYSLVTLLEGLATIPSSDQRMIRGWDMGSHGYIWHAHAQWALNGYMYLKAILSSSMLVCGKLRHECLSGWFKHIVKLATDSHNFEVACLKKKLILVVWWLSGSVTLWCFLAALSSWSDKDVCMVRCYKRLACMLTIFETFPYIRVHYDLIIKCKLYCAR